MTITFKLGGNPLDNAQLALMECALEAIFPVGYKEFLLAHNCAVPKENICRQGDFVTSVERFFGQSADWIHDLLVQNIELYAGRLPPETIAIARANCGNLICLRLTDGAIFYWDHEQEAGDGETPGFDNMIRLASSFDEFLDKLHPLQPDDFPVQAKVISVNLAPGFQEKFRDYLK